MTNIQIVELPVEKIARNPQQPRGKVTQRDVRALAANVKDNGVEQAIKVRPGENGDFLLIFGERRLEAARAAGLTTIPAMIADLEGDAEAIAKASRLAALRENILREDLTTMETARAFAALAADGLTPTKIAKEFGNEYRRAMISNLITLTALPRKAHDLIDKEHLPQAIARLLLNVHKLDKAVAKRAIDSIAANAKKPSTFRTPKTIVEAALESATVQLSSFGGPPIFPYRWLHGETREAPMTTINPDESTSTKIVEVRACSNCPVHIQHDRATYCGGLDCYTAKCGEWDRECAKTAAGRLGIPLMGDGETVTPLFITFTNDERIADAVAAKEDHLRIMPGAQEGGPNVYSDQILGVKNIHLATTDPDALEITGKGVAITLGDESDEQRAARLQTEYEEARRNREAKGRILKSEGDVCWLLHNVAKTLGLHLKVKLPTVRFIADYINDKTRQELMPKGLLNGWRQEYVEAMPKRPNTGHLNELIALCLLIGAFDEGNAVASNNRCHVDNAARACKKLAGDLGAKLPKTFDRVPVRTTFSNCHNCGRNSGSRKAVTLVEQKQDGWVVTDAGVVACFNENCHKALEIG